MNSTLFDREKERKGRDKKEKEKRGEKKRRQKKYEQQEDKIQNFFLIQNIY